MHQVKTRHSQVEIGIAEKLLGKSSHIDTTSLSVHGEYKDSEKNSVNAGITHMTWTADQSHSR